MEGDAEAFLGDEACFWGSKAGHVSPAEVGGGEANTVGRAGTSRRLLPMVSGTGTQLIRACLGCCCTYCKVPEAWPTVNVLTFQHTILPAWAGKRKPARAWSQELCISCHCPRHTRRVASLVADEGTEVQKG